MNGLKRRYKLDIRFKEEILYLKNSNSIVPINKGFSADKKYIIDDKYLIRFFSDEDEKRRRKEFNTINELGAYSNAVPKAIAFETLNDLGMSYMILSYLPGKDAEVALKELTEQEQYTAGIFAGKELKNLHKLQAPSHVAPWSVQKKEKSDHYLLELMELQVDDQMKEMLETYIRRNEALMEGRPNTFQHDDFHPANLLINNHTFSGIIDFERIDWGDPIYDLGKLGFFSSRISVAFSRGVIDGYHENSSVDESFWELYALYSAMHIVSALVWGFRISLKQYELLLKYSHDVIRDHDNFNSVIPNWYKN